MRGDTAAAMMVLVLSILLVASRVDSHLSLPLSLLKIQGISDSVTDFVTVLLYVSDSVDSID